MENFVSELLAEYLSWIDFSQGVMFQRSPKTGRDVVTDDWLRGPFIHVKVLGKKEMFDLNYHNKDCIQNNLHGLLVLLSIK